MSRPGDELLAVISARQRLSWRAFREAFDVLHSRALTAGSGIDDPVGLVRLRSLRLLSDLAHAELVPFGQAFAVTAAPTVLARVPRVGLPRAILCGSRDLCAASVLRAACAPFGNDAEVVVENHPYSGGYAPSSIAVEVTDASILQAISERARIPLSAHPPAWRILQFSASVAEYEAGLIWTYDAAPEWPGKYFDIANLTFGFGVDEDSTRLGSFQDPITHRQIHRLWRDGVVASVDRDWGRWLLLRDRRPSVVLHDASAQAVGIPATVPLPRLLCRALAMFSGLAPARRMESTAPSMLVDLYGGVSREAAEILLSKLGQRPIPHEFGR